MYMLLLFAFYCCVLYCIFSPSSRLLCTQHLDDCVQSVLSKLSIDLPIESTSRPPSTQLALASLSAMHHAAKRKTTETGTAADQINNPNNNNNTNNNNMSPMSQCSSLPNAQLIPVDFALAASKCAAQQSQLTFVSPPSNNHHQLHTNSLNNDNQFASSSSVAAASSSEVVAVGGIDGRLSMTENKNGLATVVMNRFTTAAMSTNATDACTPQSNSHTLINSNNNHPHLLPLTLPLPLENSHSTVSSVVYDDSFTPAPHPHPLHLPPHTNQSIESDTDIQQNNQHQIQTQQTIQQRLVGRSESFVSQTSTKFSPAVPILPSSMPLINHNKENELNGEVRSIRSNRHALQTVDRSQ